jgi:hypothetical protein
MRRDSHEIPEIVAKVKREVFREWDRFALMQARLSGRVQPGESRS